MCIWPRTAVSVVTGTMEVTSPDETRRPYEDRVGADGPLRYNDRGTDPTMADNVWLHVVEQEVGRGRARTGRRGMAPATGSGGDGVADLAQRHREQFLGGRGADFAGDHSFAVEVGDAVELDELMGQIAVPLATPHRALARFRRTVDGAFRGMIQRCHRRNCLLGSTTI